jgi:hypothetical protein
MSLEPEEILAMFYRIHVRRMEIAFTKTEVMDGIEQVGFARSISSRKEIPMRGEFKLSISVILEAGK